MVTTVWQTVVAGLSLSIYTYLIILLPSYWLLQRLKISRLERLALAFVWGFSWYSLLVYTIRFVGLPFWTVELISVAVTGAYLRKHRLSFPRLNLRPNLLVLASVSGLIALVHSAVLWRSGVVVPQGLQFVELSFHDSMQHLSFITRLYDSPHVSHPGFGGAELRNYHYLIDTTIASLTRFTWIGLFDSYYRIYPIFVSIVFSLSLFVFSRHLTKNEPVSILTTVFATLSGNASYYAQFIRGPEFTWSANAFLINPLVDILQNPASIFVLAQMLMVLLLLLQFDERRQTWRIIVIMGMIAGTMIGFKAWGGLLINGALAAAAGWQLLRYRRLDMMFPLFISVALTAWLFLPGYDATTSASPVWAPGWSLRRLLNDADRWNNIPLLYQEETYIYQQDWIGLIKVYLKWVMIYWLGNYWLRIIGFVSILSFLLRLHKLSLYQLSILSITITSFTLPLLFNQGRMAYDIEQFAPYALLLSAIYTVVTLFRFGSWLRSKHKLPVTPLSAALVLILLASMPSNYTSIKARTTGEVRTITHQELELYNQIKAQTARDDIVVVYPSQRNVSTLEFAAMTRRDTYYSGRTLSVITGEDFESRKDRLSQFFSQDQGQQRQFLESNRLEYLFLYQDEYDDANADRLIGQTVFENQAGRIIKL